MQRLTLKLTRTEDYKDFESRTISVDLPIDATEADLRLAFGFAATTIMEKSRAVMDGAVELADSIVEAREALEKQDPVGSAGDAQGDPIVFADGVPTMATMDERRAERAAQSLEASQ